MKIAVLVKEVPDTWGERHLDAVTHRVDRSAEMVIDEINEKAVEVALQVQESQSGSEVTVVTMGPKGSLDSLRKGLAMGATNGIHVIDDGLAGSDAVQTSEALAAALAPRGFDLVIAGNASTDGRMAAIPAMLAERLGVSQLTWLRTLNVDGDLVRGERPTEDGYVEAETQLPAVVSVMEQIAEARFPSFRGIMGAKKKPVETLSVGDLGLDPAETGAAHSRTVVTEVHRRPARTKGTIVIDDGSAADQLADYLAAAKLI